MPSKKKQVDYAIDLQHFDITKIGRDAVVCFVGKRRSGKSFALRELLYYNRDIPYGTLVSGTEHASPFFSDYIPPINIYERYDEELAEQIIEVQSQRKKEAQDAGKDVKDLSLSYFYILDDCLHDKSWAKSEPIKSLFMNGRHFNIFFILTMQYPLGIPPMLRSNIEYSFVFQDRNKENRERLYNTFGGAAGSKEVFNELMDSLGKHECLVFDNISVGPLEERVFYYKANERTNFKMGCDAYWNYYEQNKANLEEKKKKKKRSVNEYRPSGRRISLTVNKH